MNARNESQQGPHYGPQPAPSSTDKFFNSIRQAGIVRTEDRWIGGVAGGVARKFGLDPLLVRGLLAASLLLLGTGLVLYGIAWALLPEERDGRIHFEEMLRGNFDGALIGAGVAVIAGFGWGGLRIFPFSHFNGWFTGVLWLAALGGLIALAIVTINKQRPGGTASPTYSHTPDPGATQPSGPEPRAGEHNPTGTIHSDVVPDYSQPPGTFTAPLPPTPPHPPAPPTPSKPPVPKVPGPGTALVGSILGLWALTTAGFLLADRAGRLEAPVLLLSLGILIGLAGLGVVVAGLRGRTSGSLGSIAILTMILALPLTTWVGTDLQLGDATHSGFGEATFTPTTAREAEDGFALIAGDWVLDLRDMPSGTEPVHIPVTMAAGDLTIQLPSESAWTAEVKLGAGQINVNGPDESSSRSGMLIRSSNLESDAVAQGAKPEYELSIRGFAGQINIIEERS